MKRLLSSLAFILVLALATAVTAADAVQEGTVASVSGDKVTISFAQPHGLTVNDKVKIGGNGPYGKGSKGKGPYGKGQQGAYVGLVSAVAGKTATVMLYRAPNIQAGETVQVRWITNVKKGGYSPRR